MGAIHNLLERLGYVKLDRYGLLLTPEGRILSSRPAVLDDGLGGRIVGWQDGDLAAMELDKWGADRAPLKQLAAGPKQLPPAPPRATASRVAVAMAPTIPAPARPQVPLVAAPVAPVAPAPVVVTPMAVTPAVEAPVEEPQDDEDWEWTIAVARARAAADEAETAAAAPKFVAPVQTKPIAMVAPKRQVVTTPPPLPAIEEDTHVGAPAKAEVTQVTAPPQVRPPIVPKTIIPVPTLPRVADPSQLRPAAVMARGSGPQVAPPLRRVPRATDRIEDTVRTAAAPANDDKTSPGVVLPPSGGGRRVAAKQK